VPEITCYRCFARFDWRDLHFKCLMHKVKDPVLGSGAPLIFPLEDYRGRQPPRSATCPRDLLHTGFRVCPHCRKDLPYYVGRTHQRIIAVAGWRGSGKTVYLWSLLYRLRERLARDPSPFATAMFEDDASFAIYRDLCLAVLRDRTVPEATQGKSQIAGDLPPVIVRLLRTGGRANALSNLIFYDPAGELIESLAKTQYLRYLAHSAALIYLIEPPGRQGDPANETRAAEAAEGLGSVARQIRIELGRYQNERIPIALAVVLTKADETLFDELGREELVAGLGKDQGFWRRWDGAARSEVDRASARCEQLLAERDYAPLLALARLTFTPVRYFALSSLGHPPAAGRLTRDPDPVAVENPLFWILRMLD
jgi:hypothetical protein